MRLGPAAASLLALLVLGSCGGHTSTGGGPLPRDYQPIPAGRGPGFRVPAISARVGARRAITGLLCTRTHRSSWAVHLELYVRRLVLPVPAGIGIAPPVRREGAYVRGGVCSYPLRTFEPTGLVVVDARRGVAPPRLGTFFAIWGRRLSFDRLAGFRGRVSAFVGGRRWARPPGAIPLRRHAEIVLEVSGYVVPHARYAYPPGL